MFVLELFITKQNTYIEIHIQEVYKLFNYYYANTLVITTQVKKQNSAISLEMTLSASCLPPKVVTILTVRVATITYSFFFVVFINLICIFR